MCTKTQNVSFTGLKVGSPCFGDSNLYSPIKKRGIAQNVILENGEYSGGRGVGVPMVAECKLSSPHILQFLNHHK